MKKYMAVILSATAIATLLAAPAFARSYFYRSDYPSYGAAGAFGSYGYNGAYGPYTPDIPTPRYGRSYDFQGGGGNR